MRDGVSLHRFVDRLDNGLTGVRYWAQLYTNKLDWNEMGNDTYI